MNADWPEPFALRWIRPQEVATAETAQERCLDKLGFSKTGI